MRKSKFGTKEIKILGLSSLGGTLEFYDFIIFVFFAEYIANVFFSKGMSEFWALLNTYGAFAAGYLARPLGGIVMAHFGDKFGRKNMFMLSILLMVLPTFVLAFIPGYETLGFLAPVLLILIRIFQGIAIGGELPGAWVFVREHCQEKQKAFFLSCLNSAMALGILLGSIVFLIINAFFSIEEIAAYAWRIAFFVGGIFGIISIYLRRFLQETPVFKQMKKESSLSSFPLKDLFKEKDIVKNLFSSMMMTWVLTGCVIVLVLLMPKFMPSILNLSGVEGSYLQILGILGIAL
ncbi:MFS transporter, partial [Campylobacter jejuni]|nr:MFS transporter [Campylobacter jejuni]